MFEKVLPPVDGSQRAPRAASFAGKPAGPHHGESVRMVRVYDAVPGFLGERETDAGIVARTRGSETLIAAAKAPCPVLLVR